MNLDELWTYTSHLRARVKATTTTTTITTTLYLLCSVQVLHLFVVSREGFPGPRSVTGDCWVAVGGSKAVPCTLAEIGQPSPFSKDTYVVLHSRSAMGRR